MEFATNVLGVKAVTSRRRLRGALGDHIVNISKDVDLTVEIDVKAALDFLRRDPDGAIFQGEKNGLTVRGVFYDITTGAIRLVA